MAADCVSDSDVLHDPETLKARKTATFNLNVLILCP